MPKLEYIITAQDQATPEFQQLIAKLKETGVAVDQVAAKENSLAGYRREQIKEMRNYRFVVNEAKDAIFGATVALNFLSMNSDGASESIKSATNVVNKGFIAFQGMDAITSALSSRFKFLQGATGPLISGIFAAVGILSALKDEMKAADEQSAKLSTDILKLQVQLGEKSESELLKMLNKQLDATKKKLDAIDPVEVDWIKSFFGVLSTGFAVPTYKINTEYQTTKKEAKTQEAAIKEITDKKLVQDKKYSDLVFAGMQQRLSYENQMRLLSIKNEEEKINAELKMNLDANEAKRKHEIEYMNKDKKFKKADKDYVNEEYSKIAVDLQNKANLEIAKNKLATAEKIKQINNDIYISTIELETQQVELCEMSDKQRLNSNTALAQQLMDNEEAVAIDAAASDEEKDRIHEYYIKKRERASLAFAKTSCDIAKGEQKYIESLELDALDNSLSSDKKRFEAERNTELKNAHDKLGDTEDYEKAKAAIEKKYRRQKEQADLDGITEYVNLGLQSLSSYLTIINNGRTASTDAYIALMERERDALVENLNAQLENEDLVGEERKKVEQELADAQTIYDMRIAQQKRQMWEYDKQAAIQQAQIQGALAAIKSLPNFAQFAATVALTGLQIAQMQAVKPPNFHTGGTVGKTFFNEPSTREFPILVRGGETFRTEQQESALQKSSGNKQSIHIHVDGDYVPVSAVKRAVEEGLKRTGLPVEMYFVNKNKGMRNNVADYN